MQRSRRRHDSCCKLHLMIVDAVWVQTGDWTGLRNKQGSKLFPCRCTGCGKISSRTKHQLSLKQGCQQCKCGKKTKAGSDKHAAWCSFRHNANTRNLEIKISKDEWLKVVGLPCHYCGEPHSNTTKGWKHNGVDRVNSDLPYEIDNVVPCCKWCNTAKLSGSTEDFLNQITRVYNHLNLGNLT